MMRENIRYSFRLPDGTREVFDFDLDTQKLELMGDPTVVFPPWTRLTFEQCSNCPLTPETHPLCPLAATIAPIVNRFDGILSYDTLHLVVETAERRVSQQTTAQRAIGSLMGLVIATSGCPHTAFFKPMARYHLPLASREETVFRATGAYFLAQYFLAREGKGGSLDIGGLQAIYQRMQVVNAAILRRVRSATETDSSVNAIVVLDIFARTLDMVVHEMLDKIRYLFEPYFRDPQPH
jgi:hypothetical protein